MKGLITCKTRKYLNEKMCLHHMEHEQTQSCHWKENRIKD